MHKVISKIWSPSMQRQDGETPREINYLRHLLLLEINLEIHSGNEEKATFIN